MKTINRELLLNEGLNKVKNYNIDILNRTPKIAKKICLKNNKIHLLLGNNVYYLENKDYFNLINSLISEINENDFKTEQYIEVVENI